MTAVNYLWDPVEQNIVRELDDSGNVIAQYTTEPGLYGDLLSQRRNGQDSYYHYDGQGSTVALTNSAGDVTDTYEYSAFGEVTEHTGSTVNPFQYIGQKGYYRDEETGEYEVRRRKFVANKGRWLSTDPIGLLSDPTLYRYVYNRPIIMLDPSGLKCILCNWDHYIDGKVADYDKDLSMPAHVPGINARLTSISDYIKMGYGESPTMPKGESYGPWLIDLSTLKKDPKAILITGACFSIRMYVCGDCKVSVDETRIGYAWDEQGQKWTQKQTLQLHELTDVVPPDNIYLFKSELSNPKKNQCNTVFVLTDCTAFDQRMTRKIYQAWDITQTVIVSGDDPAFTASLVHEFHIGIKMPAASNFSTDFRGKSIKRTTMGDPKDCC